MIKNEELFRQFADNINVVFWRMSASLDRITYISPAFENMWGLSCERLYTDPYEWLNALYEEDKEKAVLFLEKIKTQEYNFTQYRIFDAHGVTKNILARGFQVKDTKGKLVCICGICSDITELTQMRERSHLADRLNTIGTLAAGIVHEVNNPVTWVLANLEFIMKKATTLKPEKLDQILKETIQGAKQIRDIVSNLKGFVRVDTNEIEDVNLIDILDSVLKMAASEIKMRAIVEKQFANNLPLIKANASRLQQVFLNIMMNAAQSIPQGNVKNNKICVAIKKEGKNIRIDISDTGCGIDPDKLSKIYEPFYTTKLRGIGTGLGLSITHEIIKSFGGDIIVKSLLGKGSTFSVFLPISEY